MISLTQTLGFSAILFGLGMSGVVVNRKNIIVLMMSIELMLLAVNTNFIAFANYYGHVIGQIFVFFILTVAAAEAAIGLAIMVVLYKQSHTIDVEKLDALQG